MTRMRLPVESTLAPAMIAGIMALCGLGVVTNALGSVEAGVGTARLSAAHPASGALPRAARSPTWVSPCTTSIRQAATCDAGVDESARDDRRAENYPTLAGEPFSRVDGPGSEEPARHPAQTDARAQLMGVASLARRHLEPWAWTISDEPGLPLRYGDQ